MPPAVSGTCPWLLGERAPHFRGPRLALLGLRPALHPFWPCVWVSPGSACCSSSPACTVRWLAAREPSRPVTVTIRPHPLPPPRPPAAGLWLLPLLPLLIPPSPSTSISCPARPSHWAWRQHGGREGERRPGTSLGGWAPAATAVTHIWVEMPLNAEQVARPDVPDHPAGGPAPTSEAPGMPAGNADLWAASNLSVGPGMHRSPCTWSGP